MRRLPFLLPGLFLWHCLPLSADVLDDAGVGVEGLLSAPWHPHFSRGQGVAPATLSEMLRGIPLSAEHEEERKTGFVGRAPYNRDLELVVLHEVRGDYESALEAMAPQVARPLDRARLLLRAGREAEARAVFTGEVVESLEKSSGMAFQSLISATRLLEDAEEWDLLAKYLELILDRVDHPAWRAAVWREQADIAWHRDVLPAFLESLAEDPMRLAVIRDYMGEVAASEKLLSGLLPGADAAKVTGLLKMVPRSAVLRDAGITLWKRADLSPGDRRTLWGELNASGHDDAFDPVFAEWVRQGGDISPFADLYWRSALRTSPPPAGAPRGLVLATQIQARYPEDSRFQFLLARQLMDFDVGRATKLFEQVASSRLRKDVSSRAQLYQGIANRGLFYDEELEKDPVLLGFMGLGHLNRQDRIAEVIQGHPEWKDLPPGDRARYLANGGMDRDLVKLVFESDPADKVNASLPAWLSTVIQGRRLYREIPQEIYPVLAEKMPALVMGAAGKDQQEIVRQAETLFEMLASSTLEAPVVEDSVKRLLAAAAERPEIDTEKIMQRIAETAGNYPRFAGTYPKQERQRVIRGDSKAALSLVNQLALFASPEISRLSYRYIEPRRAYGFGGTVDGPGGAIGTLGRWSSYFMIRDFSPARGSEADKAFHSLLGIFPAGHPRRLLADVMISIGMIKGVDEPSKAESTAAIEALLRGEVKMKGTELFRFLTLARRGAGETELKPILEEVAKQPESVRRAFQLSFSIMAQHRSAGLASDLVADLLESPDSPGKGLDEDQAKLFDLRLQRLETSPEAIALATRILDSFVAAETATEQGSQMKKDRRWQNMQEAMAVLRTTKQWDAWRKEAEGKIRRSGLPELRVLRILWRLDEGDLPRKDPERKALAQRILELDPFDQQAAHLLLADATATGDLALYGTCVRALGANAFSGYDMARFLAALPAGSEAGLLALMETVPPANGGMDVKVAAALHGYFLAAGPEHAARFRALISERKIMSPWLRVPLATQLCDAGREEEAIQFFASGLAVPRIYTGAPFAFPPRPGAGPGYSSGSHGTKIEGELEFLRSRKLLQPVIAALDALDSEPSLAAVVLRLAASPDAATFDRVALPHLASLKANEKAELLRAWFEQLKQDPDTAPLLLRLAKEQVESGAASAYDVIHLLREIEKVPGGKGMVPYLWSRLKALVQQRKPDEGEYLVREATELLPFMIEEADDATWADYWKWRTSEPGPIISLARSRVAVKVSPFLPQPRLREVLPEVFSRMEFSSATPEDLEGWAIAVVQAGDPELVKLFRSKLPQDRPVSLPLLDLAEGRPAAMHPVIGSIESGDGEITLWWNLVGLDDGRSGELAIPLAPFPVFDGKFDLQILGAREPGQFTVVKKVESAAAAGQISLPVQEDLRYFQLVARERGGEAVRFSREIGRNPAKGESVDLSEPVLLSKGFRPAGIPGPGAFPAYLIPTTGRIKLAEIPWDGRGRFHCSAWTSGEESLLLEFLDGEEKLLSARTLSPRTLLESAWGEARFPREGEESFLPPETVRIVLSVKNREGALPSRLGVSGLSLSLESKAELPAGFEKLGRMPGRPAKLALSPDGSRLAIRTGEGRLGVTDLATGAVTGIDAPLVGTFDQSPVYLHGMIWAGKRLFATTRKGEIYRLEPGGTKLELIWKGPDDDNGMQTLDVSHDGKWLILATEKEIGLLPVDGGSPRKIAIPIGSRISTAEVGLKIESPAGRMLLKPGDFAAGQPAESTLSHTEWRKNWLPSTSVDPRWASRLRYDGPAGRKKAGDVEIVTLPCGREDLVVAGDGTLYYVDAFGNIVRVR